MSGNSNRSRWLVRAEAAYRKAFVALYCNRTESIQVAEFPKCGGSWIGGMLSDLLQIDFPRNRFPQNRASIFHGHQLQRMPLKNVVVVWRDPRDVMVSWYHHAIVGNSHVQPDFVSQCRKLSGIHSEEIGNVKENMNMFVKWCFDAPYSPKFSWCDFYDFWVDKDCHVVSYEEMRTSPTTALQRLGEAISDRTFEPEEIQRVVDMHSFERKSGRQSGSEDKASFLRKGVVGDWENHFDTAALDTLMSRVGDRMEKLGYK